MKDKRALLDRSLDHYQKSADHDKKQLLLSAAVGGAGLFLTGVSVVGIAAGLPAEGSVGLIVGGTLAYQGGKDAWNELNSFAKMQSQAAQRSLQLSELKDSKEN